jgi:hypothetical protein
VIAFTSDYRYHWAFLTGPKSDNNGTAGGKRFHAVNKIINGQVGWVFEETYRPNLATGGLIARVRIAKITDMDRLIEIFNGLPVTPDVAGWNCVTWVRDAMGILETDHTALGTRMSNFGWEEVRKQAMDFTRHVIERQNMDTTTSYTIATLDLLDSE